MNDTVLANITRHTRADNADDSAQRLERSKALGADMPQPKLPEYRTCELPRHNLTLTYLDTGHHPSGRTFLLLHGLAGCIANWEAVIEPLSQHGRVLVPDLPGFGRTHATAAQADVPSLCGAVSEFLTVLNVSDVEIAGNSMGGLIAVLLADGIGVQPPHVGQKPWTLHHVTLIDPVLPIHARALPHPMVLATFTMYRCGPIARRVVPWYVARIGLERMGIDGVVGQVGEPLRVPKWVVRRAVEETLHHAEMPDAVATLVRAASSLTGIALSRRYRRQLTSLGADGSPTVTLIHGEKDAMVPIAVARSWARRCPHWRFVEATGVGHVPMFEVGGWVAEEIAAANGSSAPNSLRGDTSQA